MLSPLSSPLSPPLLQCQSLACERDGRILFEGLDFLVNQSDIIQIEGPNGSGKTTLLRALTTLFPDYRGDIKWRGKLIEKVRADYLSNVLFIGHLTGVKKTLTPRENLLFLTQLHQVSDLEAIDDALANVGLYGYEDLPGYQLSAGQLRRVGLARLYLNKAPLWILDEPYTAIDKQGIAKLEQLFTDHADKGGSVILTTHQAPQLDNLKYVNLLDYPPGLVVEMDANVDGGFGDRV